MCIRDRYDDYFPMGSVPTEPCAIHGAQQALPGVSGALGDDSTFTSTPSPVAASYQPSASAVHRVIGTDGRVTYVIRNQ